MKINTKLTLVDFITGKELSRETTDDIPKKVPLTFGFIAAQALLSEIQGEAFQKGEKQENYSLARKCFENDEIELTLEQAAKILSKCEKGYPPIICGQIESILNTPHLHAVSDDIRV